MIGVSLLPPDLKHSNADINIAASPRFLDIV
jgi:hypothetical protein